MQKRVFQLEKKKSTFWSRKENINKSNLFSNSKKRVIDHVSNSSVSTETCISYHVPYTSRPIFCNYYHLHVVLQYLLLTLNTCLPARKENMRRRRRIFNNDVPQQRKCCKSQVECALKDNEYIYEPKI